MDFVVIGLGLSALALLTGLSLLCLVAPRWFRKAGVAHPGDAAYARAQAGERHALGQGFLCAGAVLLLATLGGISAGLSDQAGAYLIATMTTLAALGLYGWDLLYRRQHPVPRRRRPAPAEKRVTTDESSAAVPSASLAATTTVRRRVLPKRQTLVPVTPTSPEALATNGHIELEELPSPGTPEPDASIVDALVAARPEGPPIPAGLPETAADADQAAPGDIAATTANPEVNTEPVAVDLTPAADAALEDPLLPEPMPRLPDQGEEGSAAHSEPDVEPDPASFGDDRVIALFPNAAARRSRMIAAPPDADGQS